ncbi:hypothetical protein CPB85DRAFT_1279205 [Mucidula mucida]|nr:hypothetical protein CPB85DRAFT_1279205 [Mucidula mucida]
MSANIPDNGKLNVVVVGGGYGALAARRISAYLDSSKYNLILINPRPYRIHLIACARMVVSDRDELTKSAFAAYDHVFYNDKGTFVQATVTSINKSEKTGGSVTLDSGEKIPFHVLVIATGSKWSGPLDLPNSADAIKEWLDNRRKEFHDAESIVIAGGGAVGVELAGEVKDLWPAKPVTIVQGTAKLLNDTYPDKFRNRLASSVTARGINIVYDDFIDQVPASETTAIKTRNGKTLEADLVYQHGEPVPTPTSSPPGDLRFGDIVDIKEQKQAAKADVHSGIVSGNVLAYLAGAENKMKNYKGSFEMIVVTNGKEDGVAYLGILWGIVLGGWFSKLVKSRGLLLSQFKSATGL